MEEGGEEGSEEVEVEVEVTGGSHLSPATLDLGDGTKVTLQPLLQHPSLTDLWSAKVKHQYSAPGEYRPRVEVSNPVSRLQADLNTTIHVHLLPQTYQATPLLPILTPTTAHKSPRSPLNIS
ncbi:hypothetical protein Pmani_030930 [Petrolisthes manimaculis]|uniref:PKD domain-containing protein n=1 Tax=Petrolisthes manimaculis TaxID=1843537 RepID=A0AAE1NWS2_9EUCA|nr:hypothetical protein Pmani_030930 [Petrolisthes manimaculis]